MRQNAFVAGALHRAPLRELTALHQIPSSWIWGERWKGMETAMGERQRKGRKGKEKRQIAVHGNPISQLRDVTCRMGSHSVTCHPTQVNAPRLTPAKQAGTRFTYPGGTAGWVDLVDLIVPRPGVEPATFWSRVRRRTAAPPRKPERKGRRYGRWALGGGVSVIGFRGGRRPCYTDCVSE